MNSRPLSPLTGFDRTDEIGGIHTATLVKLYNRGGLHVSFDRGVERIAVWQCRDSGLKFTIPCVTGSPEFYAEIEKNRLEYSSAKYEYEFAAPFIARGERVLDVGCGFAHFARHISDASFTGLEFSTHAAQIGRAAGRNIISESVEQHATNHGAQYDVVVSFQVIEHVCNPKAFLDACVACLRPGGRLFIGVPADDSFPGIAVNGIYNLPPHHVTFWSDRSLKFALENAGIGQVVLSHEPLADEHREYFAEQLALHMLRGPGAQGYVRDGFLFRVQLKIARYLARFVSRALVGDKHLALGHTVIGTGIKTEC